VRNEWKTREDDPPPLEPEEFTTAQFERVRSALNPDDAQQWRAWVFVTLSGVHGQRARALRHLRWRDIDDEAGVITWPAKYQKNKKELKQPILSESRVALALAKAWRDKASQYRLRAHHKTATARPERLKDADWVIFAERDTAKPVSYSSLHHHLLHAEARAGVAHLPYRGFHGFRRMVVGEVGAQMKDPTARLEYVGDRDPKMFKHYDRRRQERINRGSAAMESVREVSGHTNAAPDEGGEVKEGR
jgi:integrase